MRPPELFTPEEEKAIAQMIETDIDHALEQTHPHEVERLRCYVCDAGDIIDGECCECGARFV